MKKWVILMIMFGMLFVLQACDTFKDFTEDILALEEDVLLAIPDHVNDDLEFPNLGDYDITFTWKDQTFKDIFSYTSPFYDEEDILYVTIKRGRSSQTFEKVITLLSYESGYNQNVMYLDLEVSVDAITKEEYERVHVTLETVKNGIKVIEHETGEAGLRGRGNSTWWVYEKKPFRLRFDKNTSLLGMREAKNYVLLAEYADKSLMRNAITQKLASRFSVINYALDVRFVELYINDEYRGVYLLTEHVENHPNKLNLESIPGQLNTNYLFELDMRFYEQQEVEGFDWFLVDRHAYQIKDPDPDDPLYTGEHTNYLRTSMYQLEDALINKQGYETLLDVNQAIIFFMIHELAKNVDVGWSSVLMIKHQDGPISYGPLWDFDFAYGNADYIDYNPENWYGMRTWKNRMFILMMQIPEIRDEFKAQFELFYQSILPDFLTLIDVLGQSLEEAASRNFERWPILSTYIWPNPWQIVTRTTYQEQVNYVRGYVIDRVSWMSEEMETSRYANGLFGD